MRLCWYHVTCSCYFVGKDLHEPTSSMGPSVLAPYAPSLTYPARVVPKIWTNLRVYRTSTNLLQVSQTIPRGGPRSQIAIPAQGIIEFRDALTELLDEFGTDDGSKYRIVCSATFKLLVHISKLQCCDLQ